MGMQGLSLWACLRYVQELATILAPQNRTQGSCDLYYIHYTVTIKFQEQGVKNLISSPSNMSKFHLVRASNMLFTCLSASVRSSLRVTKLLRVRRVCAAVLGPIIKLNKH